MCECVAALRTPPDWRKRLPSPRSFHTIRTGALHDTVLCNMYKLALLAPRGPSMSRRKSRAGSDEGGVSGCRVGSRCL